MPKQILPLFMDIWVDFALCLGHGAECDPCHKKGQVLFILSRGNWCVSPSASNHPHLAKAPCTLWGELVTWQCQWNHWGRVLTSGGYLCPQRALAYREEGLGASFCEPRRGLWELFFRLPHSTMSSPRCLMTPWTFWTWSSLVCSLSKWFWRSLHLSLRWVAETILQRLLLNHPREAPTSC